MEFKSLLRKFFRGYSILEKVNSKINGEIEVRENILGERWLLAGGMTQSGRSIEKLWQKPLRKVKRDRKKVTSCLILGTGAGSVAKLIHKLFPKAKIKGIEIDPIMIKMGQKYFDLSTVKNLEIEIADAISSINHPRPRQAKRGGHPSTIIHYDLILVDLYLGDKVPPKAKSEEFIKGVKKLLFPSGVVIFNRLYYGQKKKEANEFGHKLEKIFSQVEEVYSSSNLFFLARKR